MSSWTQPRAAPTALDGGRHAADPLRPEDESSATPAGPDTTSRSAERPEQQHEQAWRLVHAAQAGDKTAFGTLYDSYVDTVFRYVLFRVNDRVLAEDLTSETFLRALRRIGSISYQGRDVGAWFVTIARNLIFDHVKSSRYRLETPTDDLGDNRHTAAGPEQEVITEAINAEVMRCVRMLGDEQRECIMLRFIQGLSMAETAKIMGKNEGAIKALQHRAVRRLAKLMPTDLR
jgi:RNA polymerase sigma-70 factor (ECF subfamily)